MGASIRWLKRQGDQRLLVVGIWFFVDEREDETPWRLDRTEGAADVEDISVWRLHDDSVIPSLHRIELKARHGESGGAPPTPDLLSVNECSKDTLWGHDEDLLQVEPRPAGVVCLVHAVDHAKSTAAQGSFPNTGPAVVCGVPPGGGHAEVLADCSLPRQRSGTSMLLPEA